MESSMLAADVWWLRARMWPGGNLVLKLYCRVTKAAVSSYIVSFGHRLHKHWYMDYVQESCTTVAYHVNASVAQQVTLQLVAQQSCCLSRPMYTALTVL